MRSLILFTMTAFLVGTDTANATVQVFINLSRQQMHVISSQGTYDWPISSARSGFSTPGGSFAPTHLERMHYSKKYDMSPMPHAIFFRGGYAIHGSYATGALGRPASHGCVRLSPGNAAALYRMVQAEGARISIHGKPPASRPFPGTYGAVRSYGPETGGYDDEPYAQGPRRPRRGDYDEDARDDRYGTDPPYPAYQVIPAPYD